MQGILRVFIVDKALKSPRISAISRRMRGRGAVGSALDWQSRGHGFESRRLHFCKRGLNKYLMEVCTMKKLIVTALAVIVFMIPLACLGVRQNNKDKDKGVVPDSVRKFEADQFLSIGVDLHKKQMYDSALVIFDKSLEKYPNYYKAMVAIAVTHQDRRDIMSAGDWYRKIYTVYPDSVEGLLGLSGVYLKLGYSQPEYLDSAKFYYDEGIKKFPNESDFYHGLAEVYKQTGGVEAADSVYKAGIAVNPENLAIRNAYVDFLVGLKRYKEALEQELIIVKAKPDDPFAQEKLGDIYVKLDMCKEAAEAYGKAKELRPDKIEIYTKLANAYLCQKNYTMAENVLKEAIELDSTKLIPHVYLGVVYMNAGKEGAAEKEFSYILSKDPNYPDALYFLGAIYARKAGRTVTEKTKEAWQSGCANARTAENYLNKANSIDPANNGPRVRQQIEYLTKVRDELKKKLFLVGITDC